MPITYKCPRCGGNDIYFAKRQRITGVGGIYGNKAKMVKTALCRACGENADAITDPADVKRAYKVIGLSSALILFIVAFAIYANIAWA